MSLKKTKRMGEVLDSAPKNFIIAQPKIAGVTLEVEGTAALIQNNFGQKSVEEMLRKHMGISVQRETKKPREVLEAAKIKNVEGRICIPPTAFKKAMVTASSAVKGFKKTNLRTQLFVFGESIPITYETETPRMDMVRLAGMSRTPDVRFRPAYSGWKARLHIQFADSLSLQSVVDLLNRAGSVGVGEWRPERGGTFGTFCVSRDIGDREEIAEVMNECSVPLVSLTIPEWALDANIDPTLLQKLFSEEATEAATAEEGA